MWVIRSLLILIVMAVIIGFAYYNVGLNQEVDIHLLFTERFDVPLLTVIFWAFILGAAVSMILFVSIYLKQYNQIRQTRKMVKGLQIEVTALRNRPIEESKDLLENRDGLRE